MAIKTSLKDNVLFVLSCGFRLFITFIAFIGIVLIVYELIALYYASRWPVLDTIAIYISNILTLLGTLFTALSIYFYSERPSPPEKISVYFTAPVISIACLGTLVYFLKTGTVSSHIVNGFALLAIAGALLRVQPNPLMDERLYWRRTTKE
ncbi:MAG TPA: hypothetical protein VJ440_07605 [Candidatus Brocadiaceae bacterium]|nr:hypothetical protein [Candidatus Brocadiaceae bacterium]